MSQQIHIFAKPFFRKMNILGDNQKKFVQNILN